MADTAFDGKVRRDPRNKHDLADIVVMFILAMAAAAGWLLFWVSVFCISFNMVAACAKFFFEMFAPATFKRSRTQARAAQSAWRCGTHTSRPAVSAAPQPKSSAGSDMPAQALLLSWPVPGVQHAELEGSTVEKEEVSEVFPDANWQEEQQVKANAGQATAAAPMTKSILPSSSCAKSAEASSKKWTMMAAATAAFDLALKQQGDAVPLDHEMEDREEQEEAVMWDCETDTEEQAEAVAWDCEVDEGEQEEVAWDINWAQQQQEREAALSSRRMLAAAHDTIPSMSAEAAKAVHAAAGKATRDSAAAKLESQLKETEAALRKMAKPQRAQYFKEHAAQSVNDAPAELSFDEQWANLPADCLAIVQEIRSRKICSNTEVLATEAHTDEDKGTWGLGYAPDGLELQPQEVQAPVRVEGGMLTVDDDI